MSVLVADKIIRDNIGSQALYVISFTTTVANGDTFPLKIKNYIGSWCNSPGQTFAACSSFSSGTFTINAAGTAACTLFVLAEA